MASILILEDDEISARLAARMLKLQGHDAHVAARSDAAWVHLQETPIDLLLLDTELDGEHGYEVLAQIRGDVLFQDLPVIVYSSVSRRDIIQRYLNLGVQGILVKPASAERLNQEVDRVTAKPWRKRLFESEEAVQMRTGLMPAELARLLHDAAEELREAIPEIEGLATEPGNAPGLARLAALKSCAINIGYLRLTKMIERMQAALAAGDTENFRRMSTRLRAAWRLLVLESGSDIAMAIASTDDDAAEPGT